uniref:Uncharacterized protein n=1 Tax=Rangifer tarandus platyrhynchus TaxID=3082113 RepID=A0ACB0EDI5_RANTA|nr:unnamed protein product [Rangifer tarandus platyrhynchus]
MAEKSGSRFRRTLAILRNSQLAVCFGGSEPSDDGGLGCRESQNERHRIRRTSGAAGGQGVWRENSLRRPQTRVSLLSPLVTPEVP